MGLPKRVEILTMSMRKEYILSLLTLNKFTYIYISQKSFFFYLKEKLQLTVRIIGAEKPVESKNFIVTNFFIHSGYTNYTKLDINIIARTYSR